MPNQTIKLFTDEDVHPKLAPELRRRGYDATSTNEAGRHNLGLSDDAQLAYAAREGRAILVYNIRDYALIHDRWRAAGQQHAGIILATQRINDLGELLRRVEWHLRAYTAEEHQNQLIWLIQTEDEMLARVEQRQALDAAQQDIVRLRQNTRQ